MTQKPRKARKGNFGELKSKKMSWGAGPQNPLVVGNQSVFIQTTSAPELVLETCLPDRSLHHFQATGQHFCHAQD